MLSFVNLFWVERVLRIAVALLMLAMGFQTDFIVFFVVAGVLGVSGLIGYCPVNQLLGLGETAAERAPAKSGATRSKAA